VWEEISVREVGDSRGTIGEEAATARRRCSMFTFVTTLSHDVTMFPVHFKFFIYTITNHEYQQYHATYFSFELSVSTQAREERASGISIVSSIRSGPPLPGIERPAQRSYAPLQQRRSKPFWRPPPLRNVARPCRSATVSWHRQT
jgi:hypothetical protein